MPSRESNTRGRLWWFAMGASSSALACAFLTRWLVERVAGMCIDAAGWREDYDLWRAAR